VALILSFFQAEFLFPSVSILVFLEVALIQDFLVSSTRQNISFNPCFSGSGVNTCVILFYLLFIINSFNPCFSGSGVNTAAAVSYSLPAGCFNPCFSGSGVNTFIALILL